MAEDVSLGGDDVWVWSGCNGMTGQMLPVSGRKGGTEDLGGEGKVGEGKRSGRGRLLSNCHFMFKYIC